MTSKNAYEEKQKDEILQQINDKLEKYDWGGSCKQMTLKVIFEGKYNIAAIFVSNKETEGTVRFFGTI